MAVFETWLESDLQQPVKVKQLTGNLFSADNGGNKIGVKVYDGGQTATLSGTVTGYIIREDNATVTVTGTLSGNTAYIVLPASAYTVVGRVSIVIKLGTTTLAACTAYVYRTITDTIVDPAHVVPSLAELLAKIGDCETATTNANTKANLADQKATLADQKATLANNAATAANAAATKIDDMAIAVTSGGATQTPTATLTLENGHYKITFANLKGATGDGFHIVKTYASVSAMEADFSGTDTHEGDFVMIVSTVEDPDNAKVYVKGASAWSFLVDMSGATGIQGQQAFLWIKYASSQPTQDSDMSDSPDKWMGVYSGTASTAPTTYTSYTWFKVKGETGTAGNGDMLAPDYDDLTFPVEKGQHCIYDDGYYVAKQRIESSEEWTAAHWESVTVGEEVTDLKSALDRKADCVYETLTDQTLAHFEDGADNLPVTDLVVGIEPVQDLNGYDYPWPGGGNNNIIPDGTNTDNGYINGKPIKNDGSIGTTSYTYLYTSEYFEVTAGQIYTVSLSETSWNNTAICFYDSEKTFISGEAYNKRASFQITAPATAAYCRLTQGNTRDYLVQMEVGSTATEIKPYSNICPITGRTGLNLFRTDKNLLGGTVFRDAIKAYMPGANIDTEYKYIQFGAGETTVNTMDGRMIAPISKILKPNTQYTFVLTYRKGTSTSSNMRLSYTDDTFTDVPNVSATQSKETIVFVSSSGKTIRNLFKRNSSGTNTIYYDECGIFEGVLTAADFTPYVGNKHSIPFGETPGTVYGATLNVKTGVLTVDRGVADLGDYDWTWDSTYSRFASDSGVVDMKKSNYARNVEFICSAYKCLHNREAISSVQRGAIYTGASGNYMYLWIHDGEGMTSEEFKTYVTGQKIVYPLDTPVTYQLTPTEVRTLTGGFNNLWADTGDVKTLTYPCDTKRYITKALSASQRIMELIVTANREDSMTASKAYESGDLLIVNNTLYKASTSIANGATLTVGTNVTETTVGAELATISGEIATGVSF